MKILRNASFWSVVIAGAAMILSQLPPLSEWKRNEEIAARISDRVGVLQLFGAVGYQIPVDIWNVGTVPVVLENMALSVVHPDSSTTETRADTYMPSLSPVGAYGLPRSYPMTLIRLRPGESWSASVTFCQDFTPQLEEEINRIQLTLLEGSFNPRSGAKPRPASPSASNDSLRQAKDLFKKNFNLQQGQYRMTLSFTARGKRPLLSKGYRMTMYQYHIEALRSQIDDYPSGAGITRPVAVEKDVWVKAEPVDK